MPLTQVSPGLLDSNAQYYGFKNRIINPGMVIDQRNNGASVTPTANATYSLDRWRCGLDQASKYSVQQSTTTPTGFTNSLLITSLSSYSVGTGESFNISQNIEGLNCADLGWGTANAQTVTLSFWVRSSLTGTFGGSLENSGINRSYPFSYTISVANTWEQKSITIAGDTTGTWLTTNGIGIRVWFSLGTGATASGTAGSWAGADYRSATGATSVVGTNGATFYITGVQLEKGSTATSFDYRPYGTELMLCQRYFEMSYDIGTAIGSVGSLGMFTSIRANGIAGTSLGFKVTKRAVPTVTAYSPATGTAGTGRDYGAGAERSVLLESVGSSTFTITMGAAAVSAAYGIQWTAAIEL
jgi:hypothetical protein